MNRILQTALIGSLLLIQAACADNAPTAAGSRNDYTATVSSISDGDTVRVTDPHGKSQRIRLAYIDAPETAQAHGIASRNALRKLLERQTVRIEVFDTDQYGRQVARVSLNGRDINLEQIRNGNAWHYRSIARHAQNTDDYQRYEAAETAVKQQRAGLWRNGSPTPPWTFRRQQRN